MKIAIGCDHGGFMLKQSIKNYLQENQHTVIDFGTDSTESVDYPEFAYKTALAVKDKDVDFGIVVCTTGVGVSIVANKVRGVRCALCTNTEVASLTRQHNDSNMLALGQRYVDVALAKEIIDVFLNTPFEGGRHQNRVDKILEIEEQNK